MSQPLPNPQLAHSMVPRQELTFIGFHVDHCWHHRGCWNLSEQSHGCCVGTQCRWLIGLWLLGGFLSLVGAMCRMRNWPPPIPMKAAIM